MSWRRILGIVAVVALLATGASFSPPVLAVGTNNSDTYIDEPMQFGETYDAHVRIARSPGETGTLYFNVSFSGDCSGCIDGDDYFVLEEDLIGDYYEFTVNPDSAPSGDYVSTMTFLQSMDSSVEGGASVGVQTGVNCLVHFSYVNPNEEAEEDSSGGSSGSRRASTESDTTEAIDESDTSTEQASEVSDDSVETTPSSSEEANTESNNPSSDEATTDSFLSILVADTTVVLTQEVYEDYLQAFLSGHDTNVPDINKDGLVSLADLVLLSRLLPSSALDSLNVSQPPVQAGPPLSEDTVVLRYQKGQEAGRYRFVLASDQSGSKDLLTFYALVDTGPAGVLALDAVFHYDPSAFSLVGMNTTGSVFPVQQALAGYNDGTVHLLALAQQPFIGTNGYIATLQFQPLEKGSVSLYTDLREALTGDAVPPEEARAEALSGRLDRQVLRSSSSTVVLSAIDALACNPLDWPSLCSLLMIQLVLVAFGLFPLLLLFHHHHHHLHHHKRR